MFDGGAGTIITSGTIDSARLNTGAGANQIVQLDGSSRLPAVDGSLLTNLPVGSGDIEGVTAGAGLTVYDLEEMELVYAQQTESYRKYPVLKNLRQNHLYVIQSRTH